MTERVTPYVEGQWPNINIYLIFLRHLAAYYFAQSYVDNLRVLDLGCGTGYGLTLLSLKASKLVALDRSFLALHEVQEVSIFGKLVANATQIPFPPATFDLVISFQVIEHINDADSYLQEVSRVLAPGGKFIVSTPNKLLRLLPFEPPFNPYHIREYTPQELKKALISQFNSVDIYGLQATAEVKAFEQKRLRQVNPLPYRKYLEKFAYSVLPYKGQQFIRKMRHQVKQAQPARDKVGLEKSLEQKFSHQDFWMASDNVGSAIDLFGICQKV
jgi:ubiquinone/menaquinone biosynthesis C-methylase UbiE